MKGPTNHQPRQSVEGRRSLVLLASAGGATVVVIDGLFWKYSGEGENCLRKHLHEHRYDVNVNNGGHDGRIAGARRRSRSSP